MDRTPTGGMIHVADVRFSAGTTAMVAQGLLGFVTATINGSIRLDGIALRRTRDGRLALSFPARRDNAGRERSLFCPINDQARRDIERQVLGALGFPDTGETSCTE